MTHEPGTENVWDWKEVACVDVYGAEASTFAELAPAPRGHVVESVDANEDVDWEDDVVT
jgi:hypothetical protein